MPQPLSQIRVLVTRPAAQAENLCSNIEAEGGQVSRFPVMEIVPAPDLAAAKQRFAQIEQYWLVIFISANAVKHSVDLIGEIPPSVNLSAVGPATLRGLQAHKLRVEITPKAPFNSEALLAHPALQDMADKKVLIVRGAGGREVLAQQLRQRGAEVDYAEVYERAIPDSDPAPLIDSLKSGKIDIVTVSSNQMLENLLKILAPQHQDLLKDVTLLAWGPRIMQITDKLALNHPPLIATRSDDEGVMETLLSWAKNARNYSTSRQTYE